NPTLGTTRFLDGALLRRRVTQRVTHGAAGEDAGKRVVLAETVVREIRRPGHGHAVDTCARVQHSRRGAIWPVPAALAPRCARGKAMPAEGADDLRAHLLDLALERID